MKSKDYSSKNYKESNKGNEFKDSNSSEYKKEKHKKIKYSKNSIDINDNSNNNIRNKNDCEKVYLKQKRSKFKIEDDSSKSSNENNKLNNIPLKNPLANLTKFKPVSNNLKLDEKSNSSKNINNYKNNLDNSNNNNNKIISCNLIKKKIVFPEPPTPDVSYVGLILGPKGSYLQKLEKQSNCKIYLRGKGTTKETLEKEGNDIESPHAVIAGDNEEDVKKAQYLIERILNADEKLREQIREEQKKASILLSKVENNDVNGYDYLNDINNNNNLNSFTDMYNNNLNTLPSDAFRPEELHLVSPYGRPSKSAKVFTVPSNCVGLLIGKNGDTIKKLIKDSCCKILIAIKEIPNTNLKNIFIEGDNHVEAQKMVEDIVAYQQKIKLNLSHIGDTNPFPGPYLLLKIPDNYAGLIVGKVGECVKKLLEETTCAVFVPNKNRPYYEELFKILKQIGDNTSITFTGLKNKPLFHEKFEKATGKSLDNSGNEKQDSTKVTDEKEIEINDEDNNTKYNFIMKSMDENSSYYPANNNKEMSFTYTKDQLLKNCNAFCVKEIKTILKKDEPIRILELSGDLESCEKCIEKIQDIINKHEEKSITTSKMAMITSTPLCNNSNINNQIYNNQNSISQNNSNMNMYGMGYNNMHFANNYPINSMVNYPAANINYNNNPTNQLFQNNYFKILSQQQQQQQMGSYFNNNQFNCLYGNMQNNMMNIGGGYNNINNTGYLNPNSINYNYNQLSNSNNIANPGFNNYNNTMNNQTYTSLTYSNPTKKHLYQNNQTENKQYYDIVNAMTYNEMMNGKNINNINNTVNNTNSNNNKISNTFQTNNSNNNTNLHTNINNKT